MSVRIEYARILSISVVVFVLINVCALGACFMVQLGPVAHQEIGGSRIEIASRYVIKGKRRAESRVGDYDRESMARIRQFPTLRALQPGFDGFGVSFP